MSTTTCGRCAGTGEVDAEYDAADVDIAVAPSSQVDCWDCCGSGVLVTADPADDEVGRP